MWIGLWVNVVTGVVLVIAYPTKALTNPVFYLKLALIAVALVILRTVLRRIRASATISGSTKVLAGLSLILWAGAITAGRLLAYTCSRLTVDVVCI
jgi:hypothetical protein